MIHRSFIVVYLHDVYSLTVLLFTADLHVHDLITAAQILFQPKVKMTKQSDYEKQLRSGGNSGGNS